MHLASRNATLWFVPCLALAASFAAAGSSAQPATASVEVHVSYQGRPVPGATVRLSGPTRKPDATTDSNGVATFSGVTPGAYYVNAAKRSFVFQPVFVSEGRLEPGTSNRVSVTKAQGGGNPSPPSFLYAGGGTTGAPVGGTGGAAGHAPAGLGQLTVGVIFSDDASPVANALVTVDPGPVGPAEDAQVTDALGRAGFASLPPGHHVVIAAFLGKSIAADVQIQPDGDEFVQLAIARSTALPTPPEAASTCDPVAWQQAFDACALELHDAALGRCGPPCGSVAPCAASTGEPKAFVVCMVTSLGACATCTLSLAESSDWAGCHARADRASGCEPLRP